MIKSIKKIYKSVAKRTLEGILALTIGSTPILACNEEPSLDLRDAGVDVNYNSPLPEFCDNLDNGDTICCDISELASYWNNGSDYVSLPIREEGILLTEHDNPDEQVYVPGGAKIVGFDLDRDIVYFYTQDQSTWNQGICQPASIYCDTGLMNPLTGFAVWRNRTPERFPQEVDHCDGLDNDCNGEIDYTEARFCSSPLPEGIVGQDEVKESLCTSGDQYCVDGELQDCIGRIDYRTPEICNLLDDDCNGLVDDAPPNQPFYWGRCGDSEVGICRYGANICVNGETECETDGPYAPIRPIEVDLCDGLDNNCNGEPDEDHVIISCVNRCERPGIEICVDGALFCYSEEVCNGGVDDDCNGLADEEEGLSCECETSSSPVPCTNPTILDTGITSPCGYGLSGCADSELTGCSVPTIDDLITFYPEICDNYDQDCIGGIDRDSEGNPLREDCYTGSLGTRDVGECHGGTMECENGTYEFSPCLGQRTPERYESCNAITDENCDGEIGFEPIYDDCVQMLLNIDRSRSMQTYIDAVRTYLEQVFSFFPEVPVEIAATVFGDSNNDPVWGQGSATLQFNFVPIGEAIPLLNYIIASGWGAVEPQLDVHYMGLQPGLNYRLSNSETGTPESQALNWNEDCFKLMITIGNEHPQTNYFSDTVEAANACASAANSCPWPGCDPSEPAEVFFIVDLYDNNGNEYVVYRDAVPHDGVQRLYDLRTTITGGELIELPDVLDNLMCLEEE